MTLDQEDIDRIAEAVVRKLSAQQQPAVPAPIGSFAFRLQQSKNELARKGGKQ
jgi:hypothetical protein